MRGGTRGGWVAIYSEPRNNGTANFVYPRAKLRGVYLVN